MPQETKTFVRLPRETLLQPSTGSTAPLPEHCFAASWEFACWPSREFSARTKLPAPSESPPQSPRSAPASAPPTPPPPSRVPEPPSLNTAPQRARSHPTHARQRQSPAAPPAPAQMEPFPAPAHSESSAETLSDHSPAPPATSGNERSHPSPATQ